MVLAFLLSRDFSGLVGILETRAADMSWHRKSNPPFSWTGEEYCLRRTAAAIGGASVTILAHLGHFPMSENPEQFRRYIAPVLSEILKQSTTSTKQGALV